MQTASKLAQNYSKFGIDGTSLLAFREIPSILRNNLLGNMALDYGCGSGRSTRFLESLGLTTFGIDSCPFFLDLAKKETVHKDRFQQSFNNDIPFNEHSFDLVFSSFVLLMISSKKEMTNLLKEMHRVLKKDGILVIITGNEHMHSPKMKWVSYETDFPENYELKRGSPAKLRIRNNGAIFNDYNWFDEDYREVIVNAGFDLEMTLSPKAGEKDSGEWFSEYTHSPFLIYLAKKK